MLDAGLPGLPSLINQAAYRPPDSAAAENTKANLKIAQDFLDVNIFDLKETYKYNTTARQPLLAPTGTMRLGNETATLSDQRWLDVYENLVQSLPKEMQTLLTLAMQLPLAQRGAHVVLLDNLLQSTAKSLVFLSMATRPLEGNELALMHADMNLAMPYIALLANRQSDATLLAEAHKFLQDVGPNHASFDSLVHYFGQYHSLSQMLYDAVADLNERKKDNEDKKDLAQAQIKGSSAAIAALTERFDRLYGGADLLALGASLHALELVSASLSLTNPGAGALLMTLTLANKGLTDESSQAAIAGKSFGATIDTIAQGLKKAFIDADDTASGLFLQQMLTSSMLGSVLFGSLTYTEGFGLPAGRDSPELISEKNYAYNLALSLFTGSDGLKSLVHMLTNSLPIAAEKQTQMGDFITTAALLFHIAASANRNDASSLEPLVLGQRANLEKGVDAIAEFVKEGLLAGSFSGEAVENFNVYLQQGSIALKEGDAASFIDALKGSLELSGTSIDAFLKDSSKIQDFSHSMVQSLALSAEMKASHTGAYLMG